MNYKLKGKGIFIFSDPAGANAVLALVQQLFNANKQEDTHLIFTNSNGVVPNNINSKVERLDFDTNKVEEIIFKFKPDYIFTGTSTNDYDHCWRELGLILKIKTIAFIDHWTNYRERFYFNNKLILPDKIWVINKIAKQEAIEAGLPADRIDVSGNPYYETVRNYKPEISKPVFFKSLGLNESKRTILFISDDIKRSFPQDEQGNSILGFDEYTTLKDIFTSLNSLSEEIDFKHYQLLIKLHPRAVDGKFDRLINEYVPKNLAIKCFRDCDPLAINYYSDFVLGMFSNMVIESLLMEKPSIRIELDQKYDLLKYIPKYPFKLIVDREVLPDILLTLLFDCKMNRKFKK